MYKFRDLYPNMGPISTREKTTLDSEEISILHGTAGQRNVNIWLTLFILVGLVFLIGAAGR